MKIYLLCIICLLTSCRKDIYPSKNDLDVIMYNLNKSGLDEYFISKGFEFKGVSNESYKSGISFNGKDSTNILTKLYTYKKKSDKIQTIIQVVFNQNYIYRIDLTTNNPAVYINLKSEIKDAGFIETNIETKDNLKTNYSKDAKSYTFNQEVNKDQTWYEILAMDGKQYERYK